MVLPLPEGLRTRIRMNVSQDGLLHPLPEGEGTEHTAFYNKRFELNLALMLPEGEGRVRT